MKLTKAQIKSHNEVMKLVDCDRALTDDEKEFVLDNFNEGALHVNSAAGAFFTPRGLARDFSIEVGNGSVIDLCAGIGSLSYELEHKAKSLTCIEINADYVRIGKRIVPDANWINISVFDQKILDLGFFEYAISNPPFGMIAAKDYSGSYIGSQFEYKVMELASRLANYGVFILPQGSANFIYSGNRHYQERESTKAKAFREQTGILMTFGSGVDTSIYKDEWHGVSPICEIVICDFANDEIEDSPIAEADLKIASTNPSQLDFFDGVIA